MLHYLVWDVHTQLHGEERRVCACGESPEVKVILDAANLSAFSIRSLIDHSVDVVGEILDETSLSRLTCNCNGAKPKSLKINHLV